MFAETDNVELTATVAKRNDEEFRFLVKIKDKVFGCESGVYLNKETTRLLYAELRPHFEPEFQLKILKREHGK